MKKITAYNAIQVKIGNTPVSETAAVIEYLGENI